MEICVQGALKLHNYMMNAHWNGVAVIGPDPGIRFNYRIGRFIKSYMSSFPWHDNYCYWQAQGYWLMANWHLYARTCDDTYRDIAIRCSKYILAQQQEDGAWLYPNPEWKGRIANAEGTWVTLGLIESYRHTADSTFLAGILRWYQFLTEAIGFQSVGNELAVNYFANQAGARVPNNSIFVLRFLAELAAVTNDDSYLQPIKGLLNFLRAVQQPTGEFPYRVEGTGPGTPLLHFQCYQYHAFACLDLLRYYEISCDSQVISMVTNVVDFLSKGVAADGHVLYACGNLDRQVTYHAAVLAAALTRAEQLGLARKSDLATRVYAYVLGQQQERGGFPHSRGDYYVLEDRRSYPRYLAMILYHLLLSDPVVRKNSRQQN